NTGNVGCEACHTSVPPGLVAFTGGVGAGNTFATTKYSHSGITSNCNVCHGAVTSFVGIGNLVVLPTATSGATAHIPATNNATCEACHLGSTPAALSTVSTGAPKALGTTGFLSPLPTGAAIHDGMTGGCSSCHENPLVWLGVGLYPRSPTTYQAGGASYVGFHTRPVGSGAGTYAVTDASHPASGDCSQCHGSTVNFSITAKPTNHIPTTAACDKCHTNITPGNANFSVMPTLTNIHAYAPTPLSNCAQCHSDANAAKYAIPSIGFAIKSPASIARHVPFGANVACETCHVVSGPVLNGASFAGGKFSHTGITSGCAACHGNGLAANYFTGISNLVAIPATAAMGSTAHIPYSAACEACHTGAGSIPSTLLAVTGTPASLTGFRTPAPTGASIHNGVSSGCNACHDSNYLWKGVDLYPINPKLKTTGANYNGFQTRPIAAPATAYGIADSVHPLTGDCSQCHTSTSVFTGQAKPAGHMPTTAPACSTCHSSDYSVAGLSSLTNLHTGITAGMVTYKAATIGSKTCSTCHVAGTGGTTGFAPFTGCATAASCAAPPPLNSYQPMVKEAKGAHVPIGTLDCNGCHAVVTPSFVLTSMMKNQIMHDNVKLGGVLCKDCHENGMSWNGVTGLKVRVPSKHTTTARKAPNNCDNAGCHANSTVSNGFRALPQPVMRSAHVAPDMGRIRPNPQAGRLTRGSLGNNYDHKGVAVGQCKTCHDGKSASGLPARHLMASNSCDTCHRATTWLPAQFSHNGITPNTCLACHNGMGASAKPAGHFMTARSCDSCHKNMAWAPVNYQHLSPLYQPLPDKLTCVSCHETNGEIIRRQARGLNRTKPIPVVPQ
ncbi:MAG: hypothetical protein HXX19_09715, partial [Rhodoferax sp.]|nr:hypothetical protein [Rhodoferax sp.]